MSHKTCHRPIAPWEKKRALHMAIEHFLIAAPTIAEALQDIQSDIEAERKLNGMRLAAGEGPSD